MTTAQPSWEGETVDVLGSGQPAGEPSYDAFISYSHTADRKLAPALRDGLQRFARAWYRRRAMRVFQDTSNLESSPDLWATIRTALLGSRAFVLLASAAAAASPWVAREVQTWRLTNSRPDRPVLIVLTDGEIAWDQARGDFDWDRTTALPRALSGVFTAEPLWVDLRWAHTEDQLSLRDPRFRDAIASLVAAIRHQSKDDLIGEDIRVWRRNRRVAWVAASALVVLTVAASSLGVYANQQRARALDQYEAAQQALRQRTAQELVAQSLLSRESDPGLALRLGTAALALDATSTGREELVSTLLGTRFDGSSSIQTEETAIAFGGVGAFGAGSRELVGGWWSSLTERHDLTVWDTSDPREPVTEGTLPGGAEEPTAVVLSPDGALAAVADPSTIVLSDLTDPAAPRVLATLTELEQVNDVAFNADHTLLAAVGDPDTTAIGPASAEQVGWLRLWDITDPARPALLATSTGLYDSDSVAFSGNGRTVVVSGGELTVVHDADGNVDPAKSTSSGASLWDVSDPAHPVRNPTRLKLSSGRLAMAQTRNLLALPSSGDDVAALYDVSDPLHPVRYGDGVPLHGYASLVFSADGGLLATTAEDRASAVRARVTQVWDVTDPATPVLLADLPPGTSPVVAMGFSADGSTLTTVDDDKIVTRWRVRDRGIHRVAAPEVLTPGSDLLTGEPVQTPTIVSQVAVAPSGGLTALVDVPQQARLWDTQDPGRPSELSRFGQDVNVVGFSADQALLATGSRTFSDDPDTVKLWDIANPSLPSLVATLTTDREVDTVAFQPHGSLLTATGYGADGEGWLAAWDITDPRRPQPVDLPPGDSYEYQNVFSPDGSRLALGGRLWDVSEPGKLQPLTVGTTPDDAYLLPGVGPVLFTDDATRLTMNDGTGLIQWDISDLAHPRQVWRLPFDVETRYWLLGADGRVLLTATGTGGITVWDIADGTVTSLHQYQAPTVSLSGLAASPDGTWFTFPGDSVLPVMSIGDLPAIVADPVAAACRAAGPLTPDEWTRYVQLYEYRDLCA